MKNTSEPRIESLETRRFFSAGGSPDVQFAGGGVATVSFRSDKANDKAITQEILSDSGGRLYIVVHTSDILQMKRLTRDGIVDTGYG